MKTITMSLSILALVPLLGSCFLVPRECTLELEGRLEPRAVTLEVGESITPTVGLYSCGGREQLSDTFIWTSENPEVASVERSTGTITARSVGQVDVEVLAQEYDLSQVVEVTVTEAQ